MQDIFADRLDRHLQANFPYLFRIWSKADQENFIISRSQKAADVHKSLSGNKNFRDEQAQAVLFSGLVISPYRLVEASVKLDFPRFFDQLATLDQNTIRNILIDLTCFIWPVETLICGLENADFPYDQITNVALGIGRYLHSLLKATLNPAQI